MEPRKRCPPLLYASERKQTPRGAIRDFCLKFSLIILELFGIFVITKSNKVLNYVGYCHKISRSTVTRQERKRNTLAATRVRVLQSVDL